MTIYLDFILNKVLLIKSLVGAYIVIETYTSLGRLHEL